MHKEKVQFWRRIKKLFVDHTNAAGNRRNVFGAPADPLCRPKRAKVSLLDTRLTWDFSIIKQECAHMHSCSELRRLFHRVGGGIPDSAGDAG